MGLHFPGPEHQTAIGVSFATLSGRFGSHLGAGLGAIWVPEHDFLIGGIVVHSQKSTNTSGKATMVGGSTAPAVAAAVCGDAC